MGKDGEDEAGKRGSEVSARGVKVGMERCACEGECEPKLTSMQCIRWKSSSTQSSPCQPFPASTFSEQCLKCFEASTHTVSSHSCRIAGAACMDGERIGICDEVQRRRKEQIVEGHRHGRIGIRANVVSNDRSTSRSIPKHGHRDRDRESEVKHYSSVVSKAIHKEAHHSRPLAPPPPPLPPQRHRRCSPRTPPPPSPPPRHEH